jgi:hypothetical protein
MRYFLILLIGFIFTGCAVERKHVLCVFSVDNLSKVKHRNMPLECFFPLAQGRAYNVEDLELFTFKKNPKQAQFTVINLWPDSSIKWVAVDLETTLGVKAKKLFIIAHGKGAAKIEEPELHIKESDSGTLIRNSQLKFYYSTASYRLLDSVFMDTGIVYRRSIPFAPELRKEGKIKYSVDPKSLQIKWVRRGKLHSVLEASRSENDWEYFLRTHFYLNSGFVVTEEKWLVKKDAAGEWNSVNLMEETPNASLHVLKDKYKIKQDRGELYRKSVIIFHSQDFGELLSHEVIEMLTYPLKYGTKDKYYKDVKVDRESLERLF